jgi:hypothetical protein
MQQREAKCKIERQKGLIGTDDSIAAGHPNQISIFLMIRSAPGLK